MLYYLEVTNLRQMYPNSLYLVPRTFIFNIGDYLRSGYGWIGPCVTVTSLFIKFGTYIPIEWVKDFV